MDILFDLSARRGYFLRREAIELGVDDRHLCSDTRQGRLVRIRQGAYAFAEHWRARADYDRYLARSRASYDLSVGPVSLSHLSAVVQSGGPLWRPRLDRAHLTRLDEGGSRIEAHTVHHVGSLEDGDVVEIDGYLTTSPTRTLLDSIGQLSLLGGIVLGDWMLATERITAAGAWEVKQRLDRWPNTRRAEIVLRFIDGGAQSVQESCGRYFFWRSGIPAPILQYRIMDGDRLVAITDYAWPDLGIYGEVDGAIKYGRALRPGQAIEDVLFEEKRREDDARRVTGGTFVRWLSNEFTLHSAPTRQLLELIAKAS